MDKCYMSKVPSYFLLCQRIEPDYLLVKFNAVAIVALHIFVIKEKSSLSIVSAGV
jgi:hypothetical protein